MDSSSRKIVAIVAIITVVILAVMAGNIFAEYQQSEITAAVEPPKSLTDRDEAAIAQDKGPEIESGFSTEIPQVEDIPAIDGKPSMVFDNDSSNNNPVAKEITKGIPDQTDPPGTVTTVE
ncbi:hypothetical protein [Sphingorhabdus sp.]|uniref:hypothetical protein n=1 Tax=Sphingorhabdus sp. TaxID=1902408 RepID=UPI00391B24FA